MKLGLNLGYWAAGSNPHEHLNLALEAERLGYDSVWTAEAYGSDAVTPLTWIAAQTKRIKVGTAIMQMTARAPAVTAMTAATLDALSGGRMLLGLGASGPQVVEGWHGVPYGKPLTRARVSRSCGKSWRARSRSSITASITTSPRGTVPDWASRSS